MLGPLVEFLKDLFSLASYRDSFVALCLDHPIWATLLAAVVIIIALYLIFNTLLHVFKKLSPLIGYTGLFVGASLGAALAVGIVLFVNKTLKRIPVWANAQETYVGKPIKLFWKFESNLEVAFQLQYAGDDQYTVEVKDIFTDEYPVPDEPYSRQVEDVRNGARYFHVRAINPHAHNVALSDWSKTKSIAQYESSLQRIAATDVIKIGISSIDHNDLFKWQTVEPDGIDIRLAKAIVTNLAGRIGKKHPVEAQFIRMPWNELLAGPEHGTADLVLAAISREAKRELKYGISFSEPYLCTTQAVLFLHGNHAETVPEMIDGKRVGFEKGTTSEDLVKALIGDAEQRHRKGPEPNEYLRPEKVISELAGGKIDFGITDMPFAAGAVLTARAHGDNSLDYRPFEKSDLPPSLPKENHVDEYAIGIRRGDALVRVINDILDEMKRTGALTRILQTTTDDYERFSGFAPGALAKSVLHTRPFECQ